MAIRKMIFYLVFTSCADGRGSESVQGGAVGVRRIAVTKVQGRIIPKIKVIYINPL